MCNSIVKCLFRCARIVDSTKLAYTAAIRATVTSCFYIAGCVVSNKQSKDTILVGKAISSTFAELCAVCNGVAAIIINFLGVVSSDIVCAIVLISAAVADIVLRPNSDRTRNSSANSKRGNCASDIN